MGRLKPLLSTAGRVYGTEGPRGLLRRGSRFFLRRLFEYSTYYLYARAGGYSVGMDEAGASARIDGITSRVVTSNSEADELEAQGFEFRSYVPNARERLDQGAVATCVFVGKEIGHIGWVALNQRALDSLDEPPYRVDFAKGEAVGTGAWTNPRHRGKRLRSYGASMFQSVMLENGFSVRRYAIRKSNIASVKTPVTISDPCGEGRYLRVLWWKSWRERPLPQGSAHGS